MKYKDINIDGKNYEIHYIKGKVLGKDKHMETRVHGGGGGGYTYQGTGASAAISISSTTIIHDKLYLEDESGKEHAIELTNWDVAVREDHVLLVVWLTKQGSERGPYIAVINLTTDNNNINRSFIRNEIGGFYAKMSCNIAIILMSVIFCIGAWIGFMLFDGGGMLLGFATLGIWFYTRKQSISKINEYINQICNEIQNLINTNKT